MADHCPLGGDCKDIDRIWSEMRRIDDKIEKDLACVKKRQGDYVSMGFMKILITALGIVFLGIFGMGWKIISMADQIKSDVASIDKATTAASAVHSEQMRAIEKELRDHAKREGRVGFENR